jgi:hypothetical protein
MDAIALADQHRTQARLGEQRHDQSAEAGDDDRGDDGRSQPEPPANLAAVRGAGDRAQAADRPAQSRPQGVQPSLRVMNRMQTSGLAWFNRLNVAVHGASERRRRLPKVTPYE